MRLDLRASSPRLVDGFRAYWTQSIGAPKLICFTWQDDRLRRQHEKNAAKNVKQHHHIRQARLKGSSLPGRSLALFLDKYLQHLAVKGFSESTLRVRRVHMEMFLSWCRRSRTTEPTQVTRASLENYQRYLF